MRGDDGVRVVGLAVAAMADPGAEGAVAGLATEGAMADLGAKEAMAVRLRLEKE